MDATIEAGDEQTKLWNGPAGRNWVELQPLLDRVLQPFEDLLVEAVAAKRPGRLLDVGCGTGSTTLAAARQLGPQSRCVGIDISGPMIEAARVRAEQQGLAASFIHADGQTHAFEPASFDMIISRFGTMFFTDFVGAFANLRRAAAEPADLRIIVWRSAAENPFMTTAERAAAPLLPNLPAREPDAPGQFAFADPDRVRRILEESGWAEIDLRPIDVACVLSEPELVPYFSKLGPVGLALEAADETTRARIIEVVRDAFEPFVSGSEVRFTAACWVADVRAPGRR